MSNPMVIRASVKDGVTEVKVLMQHPMETGLNKDDDGNLIPAWHITKIKAEHNGKSVLEGEFGPAVSKNPYLVFRFKGGAPGDKVSINWVDTKGESRTDEAEIN
jgi:sulfur-oxidizing protein SoxZ